MSAVAAVAACAALAVAPASGAQEPSNRLWQGSKDFRGTVARIDRAQAKRMTGVSWRPGCPVPLRDLRLLGLTHWGFDGKPHTDQ